MAQYETNNAWRKDVNEAEILRLFTQENMSVTAISRHLNLDRGVVKRRLEKNNISITRKPRADKSKDNSPAVKKLIYKYRRGAERRGIEYKIAYENFVYLTQQPCHYCGSAPLGREYIGSHEYIYNGLDRIDSNDDYTLDNVVSCCKICNAMKSDMPYNRFLKQIESISNHLKKAELL